MKYIDHEYKEKLRDEELEKVIKEFDEETQKAFLLFKDIQAESYLSYSDEEACIYVEETGSYSVKIVLKIDEKTEQEQVSNASISVNDLELIKKDSVYVLGVIYNDYSIGEEIVKEITFSEIKTEINLLEYANNELFYCDNAWEILADLLNELELKAKWGMQYLNEKEKEMFPLTEFAPIVSFLQWKTDSLNYQVSKEQFDLMKSYIEKSDCTYLMPLLEESYRETDENRREKLCDKFNKQLRKMEAKQLWRNIREDLVTACSGYITTTELYATDEKIAFVRNCIDKEMKLNKIEGTYPYYYVKFNENGHNIISYIKCVESAFHSDNINVEFNVAVAIEKEDGYNENLKDFYDVFYAKYYENKKYAKVNIFRPNTMFIEEEEGYSSKEIRTQIEKYCITVAKLAYGKKLDKSEKAYVQGGEFSMAATSIFMVVISVLAGLLFSTIMNVVFAIITVPLTLIFTGSFSKLIEIMSDKMWLYQWLGCWGVISGLIFILFLVNAIKDKLFRK